MESLMGNAYVIVVNIIFIISLIGTTVGVLNELMDSVWLISWFISIILHYLVE